MTNLQSGDIKPTELDERLAGIGESERKATGEEERLAENESNWWENKEMAIPETTENKTKVITVIKVIITTTRN